MAVAENSTTGPHQIDLDHWISCAPFEKLLNMEIIKAKNGVSEVRMPFLEAYAQGAGLMHGGALMTLADTAVAVAIKGEYPEGTRFATMGVEVKFLRPIVEGIVTAKATLTFKEGQRIDGVAIIYNENKQVVAEMNAQFKITASNEI